MDFMECQDFPFYCVHFHTCPQVTESRKLKYTGCLKVWLQEARFIWVSVGTLLK